MSLIEDDKTLATAHGRIGSSRSGHSDKSLEKQGVAHNSLRGSPSLEQGQKGTLERPLEGYSESELRQQGISYAWEHNLSSFEDRRAFELGAVLAQDPQDVERFRNLLGLPNEDRQCLEREGKNRWSQQTLMYCVIVICSICAAIQGMDETVVNGAQIVYAVQFGIEENERFKGLANGAPYLACAILGCWLTIPLNALLGRRGVIFFGSVLSIIACIWQALVNTWWHLVIARLALGLAIGPMSATVPMYASETAPSIIRGALTMQWQMWTAFGIMLGLAADLAFYKVPDTPTITGLNWRIMMAAPLALAVVVCCLVLFVPESPRWLMENNRHAQAYRSMCALRTSRVQAARDIFSMQAAFAAEEAEKSRGGKIFDLVKVPRNRRALYASELVMFMQQFCGINIMSYYSSEIFKKSGFKIEAALLASLGFGAVNWVFAFPAVLTIDRLGRRRLLLLTFPVMAFFLVATGLAFLIPREWHEQKVRTGIIAAGIYLYTVVYSVGPGPVPFTYSAESYPTRVRAYGMSLATATTWAFNFILSFTWPSLLKNFTPTGAFCYYGAWNVVGAIGVFLVVRETKELSLEQLDQVFAVPTKRFVRGAFRRLAGRFAGKKTREARV